MEEEISDAERARRRERRRKMREQKQRWDGDDDDYDDIVHDCMIMMMNMMMIFYMITMKINPAICKMVMRRKWELYDDEDCPAKSFVFVC